MSIMQVNNLQILNRKEKKVFSGFKITCINAMELSIMSKPQALFKILYLDGFRWFYLKYYITFFTSYIMFFVITINH